MLDEHAVLDRLRQFVATPLVFRCRPAGRKGASERFLARVGHYLHSPTRPGELSQIKRQLGACSSDFESVYARHDGFVLYRDTLSDAAGVELLPVRAWAEITESWRAEIQDGMDNEEDERLTRSLSCSIFGKVPHSGNYFAIQTSGSEAGQIYYTDHERMAPDPFAPDFAAFILRIISDPVRLLTKELGGFVRYSDGITSTQWIPDEVITGC